MSDKEIITQEEVAENEQPTKGLVKFENFDTLANIQKSLNKNQLGFIKNTVAQNIKSVDQVLTFVYKAHILGADLLRGELIGYTDNKGNLVTISTKDFMMRRAYETGKVEYLYNEPIYVHDVEYEVKDADSGQITKVKTRKRCEFWENGAELVGARATGKRKDMDREFDTTVKFSEYNKGQSTWNAIPETMIKKVALTQLLRLMFPNELGGVYDADEMGNNQDRGVTVPVVENGDQPASPEQISTLQALNVDFDADTVTKQEAVRLIAENAKKGKK